MNAIGWRSDQHSRPLFTSMKTHLRLTICLAAALPLVSCLSVGSTDRAQKKLPTFSHSRAITNPYLPLAALKRDILESKNARIERTARPELQKTFNMGGQRVEALAVEDREYANGKLAEVTLDYFAQADDGTVYYLGEDVDEYKDGKVTGHSGAWLLGKDTQIPGVLMPAHPSVGDTFKSEDVPNITWEANEVVSVSETVTVPAGTYSNCVKIKEKTSDGATEYKFYAPAIGCVKEVEGHDEIPLISHAAIGISGAN
jgi:hypothetical protein